MKHPPGTVIKKRTCYNGRNRLQLNVWVPIDLLGRRARSVWKDVPPHFTEEEVRLFAERLIQGEYEKIRRGDQPYKKVYSAEEEARGLFAWLLVRHEQSWNTVSRKTGRKLSIKSLKDNASSLKALALYWEDRVKGWNPAKPPKRPLRNHPEDFRDVVLRITKSGGDPKPREFSIGIAELFKDWLLGTGLATQSVNSHLRRVSARFSDLCRQRLGEDPLLVENPFKADLCGRMPSMGKARKRIYTLQEEQKLFDALHGSTLLHLLPGWKSKLTVTEEEQRELAIACEICCRTGVRRVSLFNDIHIDNWDQIEQILRVDDGDDGGRKGGRAVAIPTNFMLDLWLTELRNLPGERFSMVPNHAQHLLRSLLNALGIEIAQPFHGFRHTIYSRVRELGGITKAKDLLGHALQGVDKAYTHETEMRAESLRPVMELVQFHEVNR